MAKKILGQFRVLLILVSVLLFTLVFSGGALAAIPDDRFEIVEADSRNVYFTITDRTDFRCRYTDENCTVQVTSSADINTYTQTTPEILADTSGTTTSAHYEARWRDVFEARCDTGGADPITTTSERGQNAEFEDCWAASIADVAGSNLTFDVIWPIIEPDSKFDITPHCERGDDECAVDLAICYNPDDCYRGRRLASNSATDTDKAPSDTAEFWYDAGECLYDDDEEEVWACINEAFQDWKDDEFTSSDDFDDVLDELEHTRNDDLGLTILTYDDDLREVEQFDRDDDEDDPETTLERYQRIWSRTTPESIYDDEDEVDEGSYSFPPSRDDYLTIDFTSYLDLNASTRVCNTPIGCFTLTGQSTVFRQYMKSFFVRIEDSKILRCMDRRGWDTDDDHLIPLNNPDLIECDERIKIAVQYCPEENVGAKQVLFSLYDIGLLQGLINPAFASQLRQDVEQARVRAPSCLCAAGFTERDMIISNSRGDYPWEYSGGARMPRNVCD